MKTTLLGNNNPREIVAGLPNQSSSSNILTVEGLAYKGLGVARLEGKAIFIPLTAAGDVVECVLERDLGSYGFASLIRLVQAGIGRTQPNCSVYGRCGGCQLQHLNYSEQLKWKRKWIIDSLQRIGKLTGIPVNNTIASLAKFSYRNKTSIHVSGSSVGYAKRGTRDTIDIEQCPLLESSLQRAYSAVRQWVKSGKEAEVDYRVILRAGSEGNGLVAIHCPEIGEGRINALKELLPGFDVFGSGAGGRVKYLAGSIAFQADNETFFQINTSMHETMISLIGSVLGNGESLIDGHCGIGWPSLCFVDRFVTVTGVEISRKSVDLASRNARDAGICNTLFLRGTLASVLTKKRLRRRPDTVLLDPPRTGLLAKDLHAVQFMKPRRVVYISCDPPTLARDLRRFLASGYSVEKVIPVDLFPQTYHVESIVLLERR